MLEILNEVIDDFDKIFSEKIGLEEVHTMYIDYHKPFVKRIWFQYGDYRVFLHEIMPCKDSADALFHPHKWNSAMYIMKGDYEMGIGHSETNDIPKVDCKIILVEGTMYEMTEKDGWHYVSPKNGSCFTIMVSGGLNGREMPIESPKEFRPLDVSEVRRILDNIPFMSPYITSTFLAKKILEHGNE